MNTSTLTTALQQTIAYAGTAQPGSILALLQPALYSCDADARSSHMLYRTESWMWNGGGVTHGGLLATMFDNAMGILMRSYFQQKGVTINLQVNYLSPVPLEVTLHVESCIQDEVGGIVTLQSTIWMEDPARPAVTASARFKLLGPITER